MDPVLPNPCFSPTGDRESATSCLAKIRGRSHEGVQAELDKMAADVNASMEKTATVRYFMFDILFLVFSIVADIVYK